MVVTSVREKSLASRYVFIHMYMVTTKKLMMMWLSYCVLPTYWTLIILSCYNLFVSVRSVFPAGLQVLHGQNHTYVC